MSTRGGYSSTSARPTAVFEGVAGPGVVKVVVDGSGAVVDVVLLPTWRKRIAPGDLGQALHTAATDALSGWLAHVIEHVDLEPGTPRAVRPDAVDAGGDPSSEVTRNLVNEIRELFAVFDRDLERYRDQLEKATSRTAEAYGSNGRIHVSMARGQVSRVTADPRWATYARYTEIRAEALGAFRAAGRQLARADPSAVRLPASLARLRELAGDSTALGKELGLSRPRREQGEPT